MDQVHAADKALKFASGDVISSMPEIVTTNILDRLPIRDAVRTGILSRNWRFKWTLLTRLVFDEQFFNGLLYHRHHDERIIISRLLLNVRGPITKFELYISDEKLLDVSDVNHWVMFLSRKGIEEFTLINMHSTTLKLPTHLFSCLKLRYLKLHNCCISLAPTYCGLPDLLSLDLYHFAFENGNCGEVISQCRLLETLKFSHHDPIGKMKLVEFAELKNLKNLSWPLRKVDSTGNTRSIIFQLGSHLPKLQELYLDFRNYKFLENVVAREFICDAFPNLRHLTLCPIDFGNTSMVLCTFEMIWGSPNLQTLKITAAYTNLLLVPAVSSAIDYKTLMGNLKLERVVFSSFGGSVREVCLIKYLLSCSPLLKYMALHFKSGSSLVSARKLMFARKLSMFRRASSIAEVELT